MIKVNGPTSIVSEDHRLNEALSNVSIAYPKSRINVLGLMVPLLTSNFKSS